MIDWDISQLLLLIPMSCIYVLFVRGYLSDVFIPRIARASFLLAPGHIADLAFGYFIGMIVFMYMMHQIGRLIIYIDPALALDPALVLTIGFTLFYIGRLITYSVGIFYGKLHFATIFVASSIVFSINFFNNHDIIQISLLQHVNYDSAIYAVDNYLIFFKDFAPILLAGSIVLSTVGESPLYIFTNYRKPRSLLSMVEKFPSDIKIITGRGGVESKVKEMTRECDTVRSLMCVTKTCNSVDYLSDFFGHFLIKNICADNTPSRLWPTCRIIKAPEEDVENDYNKSLNNLQMRLGRLTNYKTRKMDKLMRAYQYRAGSIKGYEDFGCLEVHEKYLGDLKFLIIKYDNAERKMLFSIKDNKVSRAHVGIYTEEPYIIDIFENLFEAIW